MTSIIPRTVTDLPPSGNQATTNGGHQATTIGGGHQATTIMMTGGHHPAPAMMNGGHHPAMMNGGDQAPNREEVRLNLQKAMMNGGDQAPNRAMVGAAKRLNLQAVGMVGLAVQASTANTRRSTLTSMTSSILLNRGRINSPIPTITTGRTRVAAM